MNFVNSIRNAVKWIDNNGTDQYVHISNSKKKPYYEVTGYLIPTLRSIGFHEKATKFADYLIQKQSPDGSWGLGKPYPFDTAQVIDGLLEFNDKYRSNIDRAVEWLLSQYDKTSGCFTDRSEYKIQNIPEQVHFRTIYCLVKSGIKLDEFNAFIKRVIPHNKCLSHFWAYAFESIARLNLNTDEFIKLVSIYDGKILAHPDIPDEYCITGICQSALSCFISNNFDLGMKCLEFASTFQNKSGGFPSANKPTCYHGLDEVSWTCKFYIDALIEAQKCWFRLNTDKFGDVFEDGDHDKRYNFVKSRVLPGMDVLDAGCGKGRYINNLNCNRYACNIGDSSRFLKNTAFKLGSCLNLPYDNNKFDVVICAECLEHTIFHENAVAEMLRITKPGGKVLIVDKDFHKQRGGLAFGEEWINFNSLKSKFGGVIIDITCRNTPFLGFEVIK